MKMSAWASKKAHLFPRTAPGGCFSNNYNHQQSLEDYLAILKLVVKDIFYYFKSVANMAV